MAPSNTPMDDLTFIMTCLKHSTQKPVIDFQEVANETGAKGANTCYQRHWSIMKKWGLAGNSGKGRKAGSSPAVKTSAPRKRNIKKEDDGDEGGESGSNESRAKKRKSTGSKKSAAPVKEEKADSEADSNEEAGPEEAEAGK